MFSRDPVFFRLTITKIERKEKKKKWGEKKAIKDVNSALVSDYVVKGHREIEWTNEWGIKMKIHSKLFAIMMCKTVQYRGRKCFCDLWK